MYLLNYRNAVILLSVLFFAYSVNSQNLCDLDSLISINIAIAEENDSLPSLDPPPPYESFSRDGHVYRMLYFIHGLNGSEESWSTAAIATESGANDFPARRVYTPRISYNGAQGSLADASSKVRNNYLNNVHGQLPEEYNWYEGIAIGHSQGGVVGREIDRYFSSRNSAGELEYADVRAFGGLVTVATPNQGAQILNNEKLVRGLFYDLSRNLSAGPFEDLKSSDDFFVRLAAKAIKLDELQDELLNFLSRKPFDIIIEKNLPNITKEYWVPEKDPMKPPNDSKIPDLNTYDAKVLPVSGIERETDLVAFYAVGDLIKTYYNITVKDTSGFVPGNPVSEYFTETILVDEIIVPISWGTIHFQLNSPNDITIGTFNADTKDYLTAYRAHKTKNLYDTKVSEAEFQRQYWQTIINTGFSIFDPNQSIQYLKARGKRNRAIERRDAWKKGSVFLDKFDEFYRIIIGARYHEIVNTPVSITYCICPIEMGFPEVFDCDDFPGNYDFIAMGCQKKIVNTVKKEMTWRNKDSDGVVLVESAMDIPQHTHDPVPLLNVTHMQVRNSIRTKEMLKTVFTGGVGEFFETAEK